MLNECKNLRVYWPLPVMTISVYNTAEYVKLPHCKTSKLKLLLICNLMNDILVPFQFKWRLSPNSQVTGKRIILFPVVSDHEWLPNNEGTAWECFFNFLMEEEVRDLSGTCWQWRHVSVYKAVEFRMCMTEEEGRRRWGGSVICLQRSTWYCSHGSGQRLEISNRPVLSLLCLLQSTDTAVTVVFPWISYNVTGASDLTQ